MATKNLGVMSSSNTMQNDVTAICDSSLRRSHRKRRAPYRYGYHQRVKKLRNDHQEGLQLMDLPQELLRDALSFVSSSEDRSAIQSTSKIFRNISNTTDMRKRLNLLANPFTGNKRLLISSSRTTAEAAHKALAFAKDGNVDAIFILGMIATYLEDDLETGLALFRRGAQEGCHRCQYELGVLLYRQDPEGPKTLLQEAAATGHLPSSIELSGPHSLDIVKLQRSMILSCLPLVPLLRTKPTPPKPRWMERCDNPICLRPFYRNSSNAREWLQNKPLPPDWMQIRSKLQSIGTGNDYHQDFFRVPELFRCSACRISVYCSRACQAYAWRTGHKQWCRRHRA